MSATDVSTSHLHDPLRKYASIQAAAQRASETRAELEDILSRALGEYTSEDASLVVFGSLARDEWTSGSDLDWTYLIDGQADPAHLLITQRIQSVIDEQKDQQNNRKFKGPGPTGTFGNITFSHDLVHQIGGQHDTDINMTQRILLLLESKPIGKRSDAYERVLKAIINRYLEEDNHLLAPDNKSYRVPRFLLNDIVRFWRTMAVDFASKQRDRGGKGWGTRNAKLRMSRKLIFASGLLICFGCQLDTELHSRIPADISAIKLALVNHLRERVRLTPLRILANAMRLYNVPAEIIDDLLSSYADFLSMLHDASKRSILDNLRAEDSRKDELFASVRSMSGKFEHALDNIFFEREPISGLTRKYGVF